MCTYCAARSLMYCIFSTASGERLHCTGSESGSLSIGANLLIGAIEKVKRDSPQTHQNQASR